MKFILFLTLVFLISACDNGPVVADIRIDTKADLLKQKLALEKRLEDRRKKRRDFTKTAITKQSTKRKYQLDVDTLKQTDDAKIDYYLSKAIEADKFFQIKDAKKYALKVLSIDPKNPEAKRIYYRTKKLMKGSLEDPRERAKMNKRKKEIKALMKLNKKAKNNALYKTSSKRKNDEYLDKRLNSQEYKKTMRNLNRGK